jgi:hypothetical protein
LGQDELGLVTKGIIELLLQMDIDCQPLISKLAETISVFIYPLPRL